MSERPDTGEKIREVEKKRIVLALLDFLSDELHKGYSHETERENIGKALAYFDEKWKVTPLLFREVVTHNTFRFDNEVLSAVLEKKGVNLRVPEALQKDIDAYFAQGKDEDIENKITLLQKRAVLLVLVFEKIIVSIGEYLDTAFMDLDIAVKEALDPIEDEAYEEERDEELGEDDWHPAFSEEEANKVKKEMEILLQSYPDLMSFIYDVFMIEAPEEDLPVM